MIIPTAEGDKLPQYFGERTIFMGEVADTLVRAEENIVMLEEMLLDLGLNPETFGDDELFKLYDQEIQVLCGESWPVLGTKVSFFEESDWHSQVEERFPALAVTLDFQVLINGVQIALPTLEELRNMCGDEVFSQFGVQYFGLKSQIQSVVTQKANEIFFGDFSLIPEFSGKGSLYQINGYPRQTLIDGRTEKGRHLPGHSIKYMHGDRIFYDSVYASWELWSR